MAEIFVRPSTVEDGDLSSGTTWHSGDTIKANKYRAFRLDFSNAKFTIPSNATIESVDMSLTSTPESASGGVAQNTKIYLTNTDIRPKDFKSSTNHTSIGDFDNTIDNSAETQVIFKTLISGSDEFDAFNTWMNGDKKYIVIHPYTSATPMITYKSFIITITYRTTGSYIYNGTKWIPATPYVFNGTKWVPATVSVYNNGWS